MQAHTTRVVAVDWSGARTGEQKKLWLAEVSGAGLERLQDGWSRVSLTGELVRLVQSAAAAGTRLVVGLDFAFGFPEWYARREGWRSAEQMWASFDAVRVERLLEHADAPFWGRGEQRRKPAWLVDGGGTPPYRRTESELDTRPFSVFQLVGAGAVGVGSLRGMATLRALAAAGAAVWPFHDDAGGGSAVVAEIWPRLFAPAVVKSQADSRRRHLHELAAGPVALPEALREKAARSDDAFDALTAALALWRSRDALAQLPPARDARERVEGRIWHAGVR